MWLNAGTYRAEIRPSDGGLIAAFQVWIGGDWTDILRPQPAKAATDHGMPLFGSFPMVPFANRLPQACLSTEIGTVNFVRNWPPEGIAHHGTGWHQPWEVTKVSEASVALTCPISDALGETLGIARQDITVSPLGLRARLSYKHLGPNGMAAGLGHHPWFHAPTLLDRAQFEANGRFVMGLDHLAADHKRLHQPTELGLVDTAFNGCFSGWEGSAVLQRNSPALSVRLTGDAPLLHAYVAAPLHAICLEPVTHFPGAAHDPRWPTLGGMQRMTPGEEISTSMGISCAER